MLVVTPAALESAIVRWEIRLARQEGKTVSPVRGQGLGDLGKLPHWLGDIYDFDIPEQRAKLMSVLAGPSKQNRVPMMAPEPPVDFVQRPHEFGALKAKLLTPRATRLRSRRRCAARAATARPRSLERWPTTRTSRTPISTASSGWSWAKSPAICSPSFPT